MRIFIGSENKLFSLSGSSLVVAPYRDKDARVIGALGVIGPTRLNYARIVPMVDYTAQLISRDAALTGPAPVIPVDLIFPPRTSISGANPTRLDDGRRAMSDKTKDERMPEERRPKRPPPPKPRRRKRRGRATTKSSLG